MHASGYLGQRGKDFEIDYGTIGTQPIVGRDTWSLVLAEPAEIIGSVRFESLF